MTNWEKTQDLFWKKYRDDLRWFPFKEEDLKNSGLSPQEFVDLVGNMYRLWTQEEFMMRLFEEE